MYSLYTKANHNITLVVCDQSHLGPYCFFSLNDSLCKYSRLQR